MQGSYLFGAFRHRLPAGFTVAQYARQGFFQLCMVMGVNFLLLWLVTHSSRALNRPGRIMCTVLLAQSILLAVTALSKLALYIACFGFTPLRLQSSWLVCVLLAGCAAWLVSLWDGAAHLPRVGCCFPASRSRCSASCEYGFDISREKWYTILHNKRNILRHKEVFSMSIMPEGLLTEARALQPQLLADRRAAARPPRGRPRSAANARVCRPPPARNGL